MRAPTDEGTRAEIAELDEALAHRVVRPAELMTDDAHELEPGRAAFNRGEYFLAHELWERVWREIAGDDRLCVQGLIQIAAGLHHLQEHRTRPAAGLLRKGLEKLSRGRQSFRVHLGIDQLAGRVARLLVELDAPGTAVVEPRSFRL